MSRTVELTLPEIVIAATSRTLAGAGIAFLLANRVTRPTRRKLGWGLLGLGAVAGIGIAREMYTRGVFEAFGCPSGKSKAKLGSAA
jgi:hypothetical protein